MQRPRVAILGAGPAGLGAAWQLARQGKAEVVVLEQRSEVAGNAGSFLLHGIPVDYGSHRLHPACPPDILADLRTLLGPDLLERPRHGRIRLRQRWIHFPLKPLDLLLRLPPSFALAALGDQITKRFQPQPPATQDTFASVLQHSLGRTICRDFYFPYASKIWGLAPTEIAAAQAQRRVSAGSVRKILTTILRFLPGWRTPGAGRFYYPRHGFGQISQAMATAARQAGADIQCNTTVRRLHLGTPHSLELDSAGALRSIPADYVWSTIPLTVLTRMLAPAPPATVLDASQHLHYRAMILIYLVLKQPYFTPFDAHYFPAEDIPLTRLSEPKHYSALATPADRTVLCGELPCTVDDDLWKAPDHVLADLVRASLERCGLPIRAPVLEVTTKRLAHAYPIYRRGYEPSFALQDDWLANVPRLLTFGRQGLFAHDNTHHALAMAYAAVACLDATGHFDSARWQAYRQAFTQHVVED